jgi:ApbE superfamily uncharacterized protein (UPF0280 family)
MHERAYRSSIVPSGSERAFQVAVEETDLWVVAEADLARPMAALVHALRGELKTYIEFHPEFLHSLDPVPVTGSCPDLVRRMAEAGQACSVGPMASVAGAIAQAVAEPFVGQSPNLLVENGGDCFLASTRERVVALLAEPGQDGRSRAGVGLRLAAEDFPVALCSSSGTIGHSLSLGRGDLVAVRAPRAAMADAAATRLANLLTTPQDFQRLLDEAERLEQTAGIQGVFAQCKGKIMAWGEIELVALGE